MADISAVTEGNVYFLTLELLFGAVGAWGVSRFAHQFGLIDVPSSRSSHVVPTPKGGGIGILGAFIFGCVVFKINFLFCLSVTLLSLISLIGDRIHLSPRVRLIFQFGAAFTFIFTISESSYFVVDGSFILGYSLMVLIASGILVAVFIVGTANFYNFMDGINGIAGITGVVGFGLLAGYGASFGKDYSFIMLSVGLAMACLGFLPFNVPKAKVFMGDVGSVLLGFVFAVIVVTFAETVTDFLVLSSFLFPFYGDELVSMVERVRARQSLTKPHRRHLYQVLANEAGVAHWKLSLGYGVFQLIAGVSVWQVSRFGLVAVLCAIMFLGSLFVVANGWAKEKFAVA